VNTPNDIKELLAQFQASYDSSTLDQRWNEQSKQVRDFWQNHILADNDLPISTSDCDEIIRILDRNGRGNTRNSEAIARVMIPQGAWQRLLNEFHSNRELGQLVYSILTNTDSDTRTQLIDQLYTVNTGQRNYLTGQSGNAIGALLAAYDPINNLSIISLNDRLSIIKFLGITIPFDWNSSSIGTKITASSQLIADAVQELGIHGSARTISSFFYFEPFQAQWKNQHTVKTVSGEVSVTVPTEADEEEHIDIDPKSIDESIRESMQIQALIAKIGTEMGFSIWLPKSDRSRVLKAWQPLNNELLDVLPLGYDPTTIATIEQIDVLWLRGRSIVRAFEVEHTTSIYSGLLRMADLVAMQPNIKIKLHIVAPIERREKVMKEITRPVFALLENGALSEICSYLSFDTINEISELKHLSHLSDSVIDDLAESTSHMI
jgi:hypothetical protein